MGCDAVSVKASSNPSGSSEAEVTFQDYFDLGREDQTFITSLNVGFSGKETQIWARTLSSATAIPVRGLTGNGYLPEALLAAKEISPSFLKGNLGTISQLLTIDKFIISNRD